MDLKNNFLQFLHFELGCKENEEIDFEMDFRNFRAWNSLNALYIITRIGEETGVIINSTQLSSCKTFRDIYNLIF
jgi:acyl carrier protein